MKKIERNDPCPCGSGKKYKQCCLKRDEMLTTSRRAETASIPKAIQEAIEHHQAGRLPQAEAIYQKILQIEPNHPDALHLQGVIAHQAGKNEIAVELIGKAIKVNSSNPSYYSNLGAALQAQGKLGAAAESCHQALLLAPDYVMAHFNLGNALKDQGKLEAAVNHYRKAVTIKSDYAEAHNNMGVALQAQGELDAAIASYHKALSLRPNYAEAHNNLGYALQELGQLDGAMKSCLHALEINPDLAETHNNLGNALRNLGRLEEAEASYHQALKIKPDFADAYGNMLYLHAFTRNISPELECGLAAHWENIALNESERATARNRALLLDDSLAHAPRAGRKLKIGVVSAEIGTHAVAEFLEPFLEQLDRTRFHVTLFPTTSMQGSRAARLRALADEFKPLIGIPDNKAADLIRSDQVDILIDTTAYMKGCRLGIFAHRAAPVQCHYIGYHGSTGLTEMDWFIADEVLLPSACDAHFREGIWRLPRLWISYRGDASLPESRWEPSLDGTVWLGSFNNLTKVREETLALWAKVMNAIPEARLFLKDRQSTGSSVQERIRMELYRHGISGERVEFAGHVPDWGSHMALYDKLDIALDTIPLNSGTTAFDALWMGVPLVALEGNWMGARLSNAILKALGKPEWVAQNEDEYVAIVAALARDVGGRKSLRAAQRALMAGSPLCDAKGLTRALEDAFEKMFGQWIGKCESARKESLDTLLNDEQILDPADSI